LHLHRLVGLHRAHCLKSLLLHSIGLPRAQALSQSQVTLLRRTTLLHIRQTTLPHLHRLIGLHRAHCLKGLLLRSIGLPRAQALPQSLMTFLRQTTLLHLHRFIGLPRA
ncbi:hypothetical protein BGY98DRAFT_978480, partial [Russula aff. rugulosa BPL654]